MPSWPLSTMPLTLLCTASSSRANSPANCCNLRDGRRACRISFGDGRDVHPIERRQLIEMNNMVVQCVRDENQIADYWAFAGISSWRASSTARTEAMA